jgi:hypothetical protein
MRFLTYSFCRDLSPSLFTFGEESITIMVFLFSLFSSAVILLADNDELVYLLNENSRFLTSSRSIPFVPPLLCESPFFGSSSFLKSLVLDLGESKFFLIRGRSSDKSLIIGGFINRYVLKRLGESLTIPTACALNISVIFILN